jgi:hypothetical protein
MLLIMLFNFYILIKKLVESFQLKVFNKKYIYCAIYNKITNRYYILYNYNSFLSTLLCYFGYYKPLEITNNDMSTQDLIIVCQYVLNNKFNYQIGNKSKKINILLAIYNEVDLCHEFNKFGYNSNIPIILYSIILYYYKLNKKPKESDLRIIIENDELIEQVFDEKSNDMLTI